MDVAVASPEIKHYWEYHKELQVITRYMPVWSKEELPEAHKRVYTHLEEQLVKTLDGSGRLSTLLPVVGQRC